MNASHLSGVVIVAFFAVMLCPTPVLTAGM